MLFSEKTMQCQQQVSTLNVRIQRWKRTFISFWINRYTRIQTDLTFRYFIVTYLYVHTYACIYPVQEVFMHDFKEILVKKKKQSQKKSCICTKHTKTINCYYFLTIQCTTLLNSTYSVLRAINNLEKHEHIQEHVLWWYTISTLL